MDSLISLGLALAVGLIVGIERGFALRGQASAQHMAGLRGFALFGLLGGLLALLADSFGGVLFAVGFAAFTVLLVVAHYLETATDKDLDITTLVAALITFLLGGLSMRPDMAGAAAACAVVTAVLLNLRGWLHRSLSALSVEEFESALWLLLIAVVLLPLLPDTGLGPWAALNPYRIGWMVVLIAFLSFAGYFAVRIAGAERGLVLTGLLGGLVSSTALVMSFSRLNRGQPRLQAILAGGILIACGTMFLRVLMEVAVLNSALLAELWRPLCLAAAAAYGMAFGQWWRYERSETVAAPQLRGSPLQWRTALQFGGLLALIMLAAAAAQAWFGSAGVYVLAAVSGLNDVDAITLSVAEQARQGLPLETASRAIVIAAVVNTLTKGLVAVLLGGLSLLYRVFLPLALVAMLAALGLWWV